ncbi:M20/M25/M40 family metallo-hydrolase [Bosea vaviloviae]|uniref:Peptidase M20 dimerisation domain-containing protein n=1 Tax=Bosea vaviloviae TaxID=1526658 RepID=A0A1D7UC80_9HYPH|nr:M20/M25/M40 family metallo-hydrolase [Bosea vaviloviae]AOO84954.1 hypothetical protein BHK69_29960 [Bosea vaviloviae]
MDTSIDQHALTEEMKAVRRDFHANPEFGFEERRTSSIVAAKLCEFGFDDVAEGVGKTGVVGTLKRGTSNRAIALVALSYGVNIEVSYTREFVPVLNDEELTRELLTADGDALGSENAGQAKAPSTGTEDFARFLDYVPGSFAWIGNGERAPLHNPRYDFDHDGLLHGARVHASIVRRRLHV